MSAPVMHDDTSSSTSSTGSMAIVPPPSSESVDSNSDTLPPLSSSPRVHVVRKKPSHQDLPQLSIPLNPRTSANRFRFSHRAHVEITGKDHNRTAIFNSAAPAPAPVAQNTLASPETPSSTSTTISPCTISSSSISTPTSAFTPETPISLSSPNAGVVDLTRHLRTTSSGPVSHGGYSDIYQGELEMRKPDDEGIESKPVAIKLLRVLSSKGYDEVKARKRLNREVYVWHRLNHPNIATFFGTSYHMAGRPSLILPWFKNGSASDYLKLQNPKADRLKLILDVAEGLEYLHTCKPAPIVHGDLKGNNILITDDGRAILSDFGLSQVIEDLVRPAGITPSMFEAGPIRWQSPEFLMDVSETYRPQLPSDVWSFGCTAYELLTGNVPYHFRLRDSTVIHDIQAGIPPPGVEENDLHRGDGGIWDLMNDCWISSPVERIGMSEIVGRLKELCSRSSSSLPFPLSPLSILSSTAKAADDFITPASERHDNITRPRK